MAALVCCDLLPFCRSSTEREAQMLGLFVAEILSPLRRWLQDKEAFEKETEGNCCFALTYRFADNKAKHCHLVKGARKWEARILDGLVQSRSSTLGQLGLHLRCCAAAAPRVAVAF